MIGLKDRWKSLEEEYARGAIVKSLLKCSKCGEPQYHSLKMSDMRDEMIDQLLESEDPVIQEVGRKAVDQCLFCICQNPELNERLKLKEKIKIKVILGSVRLMLR